MVSLHPPPRRCRRPRPLVVVIALTLGVRTERPGKLTNFPFSRFHPVETRWRGRWRSHLSPSSCLCTASSPVVMATRPERDPPTRLLMMDRPVSCGSSWGYKWSNKLFNGVTGGGEWGDWEGGWLDCLVGQWMAVQREQSMMDISIDRGVHEYWIKFQFISEQTAMNAQSDRQVLMCLHLLLILLLLLLL